MRIIGIVIGLILFLALVLSTCAGWDVSWSNLNAYGFIEPVHFSNLVDAVNERTDLLVQRAYPYAYPAAVTAHLEYVECSSVSTGRYACSTTTTTYVEGGVTNPIAYTNYCLHWTTICTTNELKNDFIAGALLKAIDDKLFQLIPYFVNQELEGTNHYSAWLSLTNMDFPYYTATGLFETVGIMQSGKLYDVQSTGLYVCGTTTTNIGTNVYVYTNYCLGFVTNYTTNACFSGTGTNGTTYDFVSASNLLERYEVLNKLAWVSGDKLCIKDKSRGFGSAEDTDCQATANSPTVDVCDAFFIPDVDDWEDYEEYAIQTRIGNNWSFAGGHYLVKAKMMAGYEGCSQGVGFVWRETGNTEIFRDTGRPITAFSTSKTCNAEFYLLAPKIATSCVINAQAYNESRVDFYKYYSESEQTVSVDADYDEYDYYFPYASETKVLTIYSTNAVKHNEGLESYSFHDSCRVCGWFGDYYYAVWTADYQEDHPTWTEECAALARQEFDYECVKNYTEYMTINILLYDYRNVIEFSESTVNKFISLIKYTPEFHE